MPDSDDLLPGQVPPEIARWSEFTDEELSELWESTTKDDGIRYSVAADEEPTLHRIVRGIAWSASKRGLDLPDAEWVLQ